MKLVSWNIAHQEEPWNSLEEIGVDVALLQEAGSPPSSVAFDTGTAPWSTAGVERNRPWRTAVVCLSDRVRINRIPMAPIAEAAKGQLAVSREGTIAAAEVEELATGQKITVVSMYGVWEDPMPDTGSSWIYADASVHRTISDMSSLIGRQSGHEIIVAGDLNVLHAYGEGGSPYWARRYSTIFERFESIGLSFVGPQAPNGVPAEPRLAELPESSNDVPTFRTHRSTPSSASRQLDFVFASAGLADRVEVRALNRPDEWGPSDHCRVMIELST